MICSTTRESVGPQEVAEPEDEPNDMETGTLEKVYMVSTSTFWR
jgi:hypothetical protein